MIRLNIDIRESHMSHNLNGSTSANCRRNFAPWRVFALCTFLVFTLALSIACRRRSNAFVIALSDNLKTIDPIGSPSVDAASERVRSLMFNSLVKKDEKFDYVPELAASNQRSDN